MKSSSAIVSVLAVAGSTFAAPAPKSSFQGLALRSGSPIQYATVNAHGNNFWLLYPTRTSCPSGVSCSNTTATLFTGGKDTLSLKVEVPGGQQVYVDDVGTLKYTEAHSAAIGEGSSQTGFGTRKSGQFDILTYQDKGFLACPTDADNYLIYTADSSAVKGSTRCLGFDFLIGEDSAPAAWEYD